MKIHFPDSLYNDMLIIARERKISVRKLILIAVRKEVNEYKDMRTRKRLYHYSF